MVQIRTRVGLALATLLLLSGTALTSAAHAALNPFVTIERSCDVNVSVGQRVCVQYGYNPTPGEPQRAIGLLTVQKGDNPPAQLFLGEVFADTPNEFCDVVGLGPRDRILRFTVETATGFVESANCRYRAGTGSQTQPIITTRLLRNRQAFVECGSPVPSGDIVHLVFSSSESGFAEVFLQKEGQSATFLARGSVNADVNYAVGVRAGLGDGKARTFIVRVTNNASATGEATCAYAVILVGP
jgi:hypothetical protein